MTRRHQRLVGIIAAITLVVAGLGYLGLRSRSSNANAASAALVSTDVPVTSPSTATTTSTISPSNSRALKEKAAEARRQAKALKARIAKAREAARPTASPTPKPGSGSGSSTTPPAAPATSSAKKGAALWNQDGITASLKDSGVSWFYNWAPDPQGVQAPAGVEFVPMIWGADSVTAANLATVKKNGDTLLGFNEPDLGEQSNMSVEKALELWPQLEKTGMRLGSPAVAWGADADGEWLDRFMDGAGSSVDFITLHWYGSDFNSTNATAQLKSYIEATHKKYGKPIWLTEYSLMNFAAGAQKFPSAANQAEFVEKSTKMLESLDYVEHYSWFAFPTSKNGQDETGLYRPGGTLTAPGKAYRSAG
ncbi:glycoside hydrolase family protein [Kineosporia succinea]|uniref:Asl1-like glycosyl hydrolase catalytic domain-containing protein n=1 Tax=Kineosporia succinea TaxID=84632 RepID=A0ABT9NYL0_9ACTN|nr:glycoside hydrolase family protein [Kineosporia succinea]MDP9825523.1 hypothetical protein [Kineosporia succinea]